MSDIVDKVRELSRIKADIAKLNDRRKELEAYFLERGGDDVVDTKFKSTVYADPDSQAAVTYTEALASPVVPQLMKEAISRIAAPAIRNAGTFGGNLGNGAGGDVPRYL